MKPEREKLSHFYATVRRFSNGNAHGARCRLSGKIRYRTEEQAIAALEGAMLKRKELHHPWRQEERTYHCDYCQDWHLTSKKRSRA